MNKLIVMIPVVFVWLAFIRPPETGYIGNRCEEGILLRSTHPAREVVKKRFDELVTTFQGTDFGNIEVKFGVDSLHRLNSARLVQVVHPTFDSLVLATLNSLDSTYFLDLSPGCYYRLNMFLGDHERQSDMDAFLILMADGNYKKSISYATKSLKKSPTNSQLLYYLGRAQIETGNKLGRNVLIQAARMGDEDAYEYLLGEE